MGYDAEVKIIFGVSLSECDYKRLMKQCNLDKFKNLGTGKDPNGDLWIVPFADNEDEENEIIYAWLDDITLYNKYHLFRMDDSFFLALHVHTHIVTRSTERPKEMYIPLDSEVKRFKKFLKLTNIKTEYKVTSIVIESY